MFIIIFIAILYFTFLGGSLYTITSFPLKVTNHIAVTLILSLWLWPKLKLHTRQPLPRFPLEWPLLAWLLVQLLSAAASWYPRFSIESLWLPIIHVIALYMIIDLLPRWGGAFIRAIYLSSAVVCLVGLAEFSSWYFGLPLLPQFQQSWFEISGWANPIPPYWYRLNFTLNGATSLSAYLALLIPPALTMWLTTRKKDDKQALAVWLLLALLVQLLAFSRGGLLALGVSLPLCLAGWFLVSRGESHYLKRLKQIPLKVIGATGATVLVIGLIGLVVIGRRSLDASSGDQVRVNLWQSAIQMAVDHPVLGVGPKLYGRALRDYRDPQFARNQITTAHNLYLNSAAETGLAGLGVGLWALMTLIVAAWRNWQQTTSPSRRIRLLGIGAALSGFAVQSLVDTFNATQIILPMIIGIGYLLMPHQVSYPQPKAVPWRSIVLASIVIGYVVILGRWDMAQAAFERASGKALTQNYDEAIAEIDRAITLDPQLHLYQFERAYYLAHQSQSNPEQLALAIAQYRAALQQEGSNPTYWANLAGLLAQANEGGQAIITLEMALTQAPSEPTYLLNLGQLYAQNGKRDQALAYFTQAIIQQPTLLDSGFWSAEDHQALLTMAAEQIDSLAYRSQLALAAGDPSLAADLAQQAVTEHPSRTRWLALVKAKLAQDQPTAALEILNYHETKFSKTDGEFYLRRGQARWLLSEQNDDTPTAFVRDLQTALFISPFNNREAYYYLGQWWEAQGQLEAAISAYQHAIPPQVITQNYDVAVYGRSTRHQPLVPQLLDLGLPENNATPILRLINIHQAAGNTDECIQLEMLFEQLYPYAQADCSK